MKRAFEEVRTDDELAKFMRKYEALRQEGLTNAVIAQRMGLTPSGINERRKLYRTRIKEAE